MNVFVLPIFHIHIGTYEIFLDSSWMNSTSFDGEQDLNEVCHKKYKNMNVHFFK